MGLRLKLKWIRPRLMLKTLSITEDPWIQHSAGKMLALAWSSQHLIHRSWHLDLEQPKDSSLSWGIGDSAWLALGLGAAKEFITAMTPYRLLHLIRPGWHLDLVQPKDSSFHLARLAFWNHLIKQIHQFIIHFSLFDCIGSRLASLTDSGGYIIDYTGSGQARQLWFIQLTEDFKCIGRLHKGQQEAAW